MQGRGLMYSDITDRTPQNEKELLDFMREHFRAVEHILCDFPFETKEDAISGKYRDGGPKGAAMDVIRYRDIDPDYDNRKYFYDMGRDKLPLVAQLLDEGELTPELIHEWGMIMFCHGYVAAHIFDDSDDLQAVRAGSVRPRDRHRKWVAKALLEALSQPRSSRAKAEKLVFERVKNLLAANQIPDGFKGAADFEKILTRDRDALKTSYTRKYLSVPEMRKIIGEG